VKDEDKTKEQLIAELAELRHENIAFKLAQKGHEYSSTVSDMSLPSRCFSTGRNEVFVSNPPVQQQAVNPPMKYKLSDLIDISLVQQLMNLFYVATGIPHAILDIDNNILSGIGWQDICTQFHRGFPHAECNCKQSDSYIADHLVDTPYIGYKCLNGLMDYAAPIIIEGQHLATIFMGQLLHEPPDEEFFRRQANEYGFDESAYMQALERVPIFSEGQIKNIMDFYSQLGQVVANMGIQRLRKLEVAKLELRDSKNRVQFLSGLFEKSSNPVAIANCNGQTTCNSAFCNLTGYSEEELCSMIWYNDITPPEWHDIQNKMLQRLQITKKPQRYEKEFWRKDRSRVPVEVVIDAIYDSEDNIFNYYAFVIDITERKRVETELRISEARYRAIVEDQTELICRFSPDRTLLFINKAFGNYYHKQLEDLIGNSIIGLIPDEDVKEYEEQINSLSKENPVGMINHQVKLPDGMIGWLRSINRAIFDDQGNIIEFQSVGRDITEHKHIMKMLQDSEDKFSKAFHSNPDLMSIRTLKEGRFLEVNDAFLKCLGYERDEVIGRTSTELNILTVTGERDRLIKQIQEYGSIKNRETYFQTKTGEIKIFLLSADVIEINNESYILGISKDITDRKQMEEALRLSEKALWESERRFREMLENVKLAATIMDNNCRIVFCNDYLIQLLGWKREEILEKDWLDTFVPDDIRERDRRIINRSLHQGSALFFGESELITRSGKRRTIQWSNMVLLNPDGSSAGFAGIGEDITERRATEKRSQELVQELEFTNRELKDFAHIVSHDLKAPLLGIRSLTEWLANDYQDKLDEKGKRYLDIISNRTKRMHNLLEGILRYSKLSYRNEEKMVINLNEVVVEVVDMLALPDSISIIIENDMPLLKLDRTRTQQLFENLISNAIKYMDKPNGQIRISCHDQGEFWQFNVQDNGCGIEAKHFERIFKVFQTLKPRDEFESTGIGLTIVKKIVEMYGGKIWVESKVGEGSTFHFTLPRLQYGF